MTDKDHDFAMPVTVYWENTDMGGIVYHSQYLNFAERARCEWIKQKSGIGQIDYMNQTNAGFVVKLAEIDFIAPARLDDVLMVSCTVTRMGRTSFDLQQDIWRQADNQPIASITLKMVTVDTETLKPVKVPAELVQ